MTLDGREPSDFSKAGIGKDDYVRLSFKNDMLVRLEACARDTPETTIPARENLRQLIAAVKSLCGKSEDAEMEDAIFRLITKDDDSVRAALAIRGVTSFREQVLKTFTGTILALVKASFPKAAIPNDNNGFDWYYIESVHNVDTLWTDFLEKRIFTAFRRENARSVRKVTDFVDRHYIEIPVREGNYLLQVNYDWTSAWLSASESRKTDSASREWANLNKKMKELFKFEGESAPKERLVWRGEDISWPSLDSYVNNNEYDLYLAHLSKRSPREIADKIIGIARELENVKV